MHAALLPTHRQHSTPPEHLEAAGKLPVQHCNNLFGSSSELVAIEDLHCRIEKGALSELSSMTQVGQAVRCSLMSGSFAAVTTLCTWR